MERVSSTVAKAIKEAGYPLMRFQTVNRQQFESGHGYKYSTDKNLYSESPSVLYPEDKDTIDLYYCPTYIDAWLWLWRVKKIEILSAYDEYGCVRISFGQDCEPKILRFHNGKSVSHDPEAAIIAAIEFLVDNNLLK